MPTEVNCSPTSRRAQAASISLAPLAIIAVLILVIHVACGTLLASPQAHASIVVPDVDVNCHEATLPQPSLPFD